MTQWGVFRSEDAVHVIPCDENGVAVAPHVAATTCACNPRKDENSKVFVHEEIN